MDASNFWHAYLQDYIKWGRFDETCSIDDFMTYSTRTTSGEVPNPRCRDGLHLTVFWHHKSDAERRRKKISDDFWSDRWLFESESESESEREPELGMLQDKIELLDKIKSVMESVKFWSDSILLQFWAPKEIICLNQKILTALGQPFGLGRRLTKGLCWYRKRCLEHAYNTYGSGEDSQLGPPGRVFQQGYPEFCPNIEAYTTQEFPLRDFAVHQCGIEGYWALPVFERCEQQQQCLGVLEFVAMRSTNVSHQLNPVFSALENVYLKCPSSYFHECDQIRKDVLSPRVDLKRGLDFVRKAHHLPLIQAWVPCMCDDPDTHVGHSENSCRSPDACKTSELFCDIRSCDRNIMYVSDIAESTRKYGAFSVRKGKCLIGKAYALNKPCFSRYTSHFSISDYPFVHLTRRAGLTACFAIPLQFIHPMLDALFLEIFLPTEQLNYNNVINVASMLKSLLSTVAQGFSRLNVSLGLKLGEEFSVKVSHSDDEFLYFDICRSAGNLSRHDEALENTRREELQLQFSHPPTTMEINVTNEKTNAVVTKKHSSVTYSQIQDRVEPSTQLHTNVEGRITLDVLKLHFGRNLVDAAESLEVSRSTLKRICRRFGINRWPSHKRKKVDHYIHSSPRLPTESTRDVGEEVTQESAGGHEMINALENEAAASMPTIVNGNNTAPRDEIDNKDTMIVKANYRENLVKFPLSCNSGIEYLSHEIARRFELEVGSFTVKYEDEDSDWIMIPCDEDLRYRMETLKSLGQSSIRLSVFTVTT